MRTVIEMRSSENKELRSINNKLNEKIEQQSWLETELEKAKRRLEELALIVQNKMVSEGSIVSLFFIGLRVVVYAIKTLKSGHILNEGYERNMYP